MSAFLCDNRDMGYLIFLAITLGLLAAFYALTWYEAKRGVRVLAARRSALDNRIAHIEFIVTHVDFASFTREELSRFAHGLSHLAAHISLQAVRAVERLLTRLVRHLRTRQEVMESAQPRETMRDFVKTLSDFKGELETTRPVREQEAFVQISQIG